MPGSRPPGLQGSSFPLFQSAGLWLCSGSPSSQMRQSQGKLDVSLYWGPVVCSWSISVGRPHSCGHCAPQATSEVHSGPPSSPCAQGCCLLTDPCLRDGSFPCATSGDSPGPRPRPPSPRKAQPRLPSHAQLTTPGPCPPHFLGSALVQSLRLYLFFLQTNMLSWENRRSDP